MAAVVLCLGIAGCTERAAEPEAVPRCATVTDLFRFPADQTPRFADTDGDGVPEVWRVEKVESGELGRAVGDALVRTADGSYRLDRHFELEGSYRGFADFDGDGRDDVYLRMQEPALECWWSAWHSSDQHGVPEGEGHAFQSYCDEIVGVLDLLHDGRHEVIAKGAISGALSIELVATGRVLPWANGFAGAEWGAVVEGDPELVFSSTYETGASELVSLHLRRFGDEGVEDLWQTEPLGKWSSDLSPKRTHDGVQVLLHLADELHRIEYHLDGTVLEDELLATGVDRHHAGDLDGDGFDDVAWTIGRELHVRFGGEHGRLGPEQAFTDLEPAELDPATQLVDHDGDGALALIFRGEKVDDEQRFGAVELGACAE